MGETLGEAGDNESESTLQREEWIESVGGPYKGYMLGFCPQFRASSSGTQAPLSSRMMVDSAKVEEL